LIENSIVKNISKRCITDGALNFEDKDKSWDEYIDSNAIDFIGEKIGIDETFH
jgi:hypothetical protein